MLTNEQRDPDFVFQIPDPPTDCGLLYAKRRRSLAKTPTFCRRNHIAKMTQFNCHGNGLPSR